MTDKNKQKAVIYCRVSSAKQTKVGDGLASQETRCREFARMKGYEVAGVYQDDVSGSMTNRPGMKAMLSFVRGQRGRGVVIIIDDVSRLARGLEAHLQLRSAISAAGGVLESPSIEFGEDPDSLLVENLLATVAQHQRQKNGEQTKNRMRARVMNGYWCFQAPIGYRYAKSTGQGKMLVRDEPHASIITEALEGFASGRFQIKAEVRRFLEDQPDFPKNRYGVVTNQRVFEILSRPVYAGYVHAPEWGVSLRKGHHEPLITLGTWQRVQDRLYGKPKTPARADLNQDFPLRGFVACADCGYPLTACWSKGSHGRYPYYLCPKKGCVSYGKSIRREALEGAFEEVLKDLQPTPQLFAVATDMFRDLWDDLRKSGRERRLTLEEQQAALDRKIAQITDRIVDAGSDALISAYEKRLSDLEKDRLLIAERISSCGRELRDFDETLRTALTFLGNPHKIWRSEHFEDKRAVLKLTFADRLVYDRRSGYRTANLSLPFKVLQGGLKEGEIMAPQRG